MAFTAIFFANGIRIIYSRFGTQFNVSAAALKAAVSAKLIENSLAKLYAPLRVPALGSIRRSISATFATALFCSVISKT